MRLLFCGDMVGRSGRDVIASDYSYGRPGFGALRTALDPNEAFRPALLLVAIVLLVLLLLHL